MTLINFNLSSSNILFCGTRKFLILRLFLILDTPNLWYLKKRSNQWNPNKPSYFEGLIFVHLKWKGFQRRRTLNNYYKLKRRPLPVETRKTKTIILIQQNLDLDHPSQTKSRKRYIMWVEEKKILLWDIVFVFIRGFKNGLKDSDAEKLERERPRHDWS